MTIIPPIDASPLNFVSGDAFVLHTGWQMRESALLGQDGPVISIPGFSTENWYGTALPATALGVLIRNGVYPDPYLGTNNMHIPDACDAHNVRYNLCHYSHLPSGENPWAKPYWFRKEFVLPDDYAGRTIRLHLDGINYRADVWLNGHLVADSRTVVGMFRRFQFDITRFLHREGTPNALAILVHPLDIPGDPAHEQIDGLPGSFGPNGGDGQILRNVTQYSTVGWDWIAPARDRNMGLWQHVWLEASGPVVIHDPAAFTEMRLPDTTEASITVRCHLENLEQNDRLADLIVRIAPEGADGEFVEFVREVRIPAGGRQEFIFKPEEHPELLFKNPRLWWPVTYGEQPLYTLAVEVRTGGRRSHKIQRCFGIRTVGTRILPSGGRAFTVNGRTLRLTGGAWVPDFLLNWDAQRYRDEIRLMAEGNHTVVRVNGCGIVPPDVFFDACDRLGLLVWQDLSRTSVASEYRTDWGRTWNPPPCDPGVYLDNMKDCILRLRGHPCLLVWCGCNEAFAQKDTGTALQNDILPALDASRPWLPSSSEPPPWRNEDIRTWTGGPWHMVRLPEYFELYRNHPEFTSRNEIGLASFPPINSLVKAIPDFDEPVPAWFPLNRSMGYHDATHTMFRASDDIIRRDLGEPGSLTEYLWMGDLYNNQCYRAIFEAANKNRPRNSGTHLWKVNAAWPSFVWQVFDWYLRPNAGYYSMRSACKPLHIQFSIDDRSIQISSTLLHSCKNLLVRVKVLEAGGKEVYRDEFPACAEADATTPAGFLPSFPGEGNLCFLSLELTDTEGNGLDRVVTWVQADCRWHDLLALPPAEAMATILERTESQGESCYRISLTNCSPVPAVQIWLEILRGPQGDEVLPSFWNDNAITLLPGEEREISVKFRTADLHGNPAHLILEGWNLIPREYRVEDNAEIPLAVHVESCRITSDSEGTRLVVTAAQEGPLGSRITTWPVPVQTDGNKQRYVRMGLRTGQSSRAILPVGG